MSYRVVIIEDDPMVVEVNRQYVEAAGPFQVVATAARGQEGIRRVCRERPDLVILDHYLPDLNGLDVLREIRRLGVDTDVVMVTAAQDPQVIREVLRFGAIDYVIKPFKAARLAEALGAYRRMREKLLSAGNLSQEQVDRLTRGPAPAPPPGPPPGPAAGGAALPKGLTDWTLRQVLLYLINQARPSSAAEVGTGVGLARVTARRYLDWLVQQGRAQVHVTYGSIGRPVYRYSVR